MRGKVQWFNDSKGYGFLEPDEAAQASHTGHQPIPPVFVHYTAIQGEGFKTLGEEQLVDFDLIEGPKGPQAQNVRKVGI